MGRSDAKILLGAVEGGGTKFVCAVGLGPQEIIEHIRIPTTTPERTLGEVTAFFERYRPRAIGVGTFGPLELDRGAGDLRGSTLRTPKSGWDGVRVRQQLVERFGVPVTVDTDVNAAALAEGRWGAGQGADPLVYITVGTGIGGGVVIDGKPLHGLMHAELGHMLMPVLRDAAGKLDDFAGVCRFHGRCMEGLCAGPAIRARTGHASEELAEDHPAWALVASYLAWGLSNLVLALSPQRIILGGGVMNERHLFAPIRRQVRQLLADYVPRPQLSEAGIDGYIVPPVFEEPGLVGAFALAMQSLES